MNPVVPMSIDRSRRAAEIFELASELPEPERAAFIREQCANEPELAADVESLFDHLRQAATFLERPPIRLAPTGTRLTDPTQIGPYRILHRIGEGGFGIVYEAEQTAPLRRRVAVKVIKAGMDTDAVLARFDAERQAIALMDHPNIARVLDAGATPEGRPYFVMELVKGEPLTEYCDRHRLTVDERLELFIPTCMAVQHAHQRGIIHRDLKPSNIMVTVVDGRAVPKVIDFGVAKATSTHLTDRTLYTMQGQMIGTPAYMSPEQAERTGLDVDTTTDVYALGVILYELLSGHLPIPIEDLRNVTPEQVSSLLRNSEPAAPSSRLSRVTDAVLAIATRRQVDPWVLTRRLRGELDWITLRAIEKDRTRRYQTASELAQDIQRHLSDEPVEASPPSTLYRLRKFVRRHRVAFAAVSSVFLGLVIAGGALTLALLESNRQRTQARIAQSEAEAVTQFLQEMLGSVSPMELGREATVRELLDHADGQLDEDFQDQPLTRASLYGTLGATYRALGEYDAADRTFEKAIALRREHLGEDNPLTLEAEHGLAISLMDRGESAAAESTSARVLEARTRVLGPEHPQTIRTLRTLGEVYFRFERNAEAESVLVIARDRAERVLGPADPATRGIVADLASVERALGKYEEAERLLEKSLEEDRAEYGPDHPETIASEQNLAGLYEELGRYEEARQLYEHSVEVARRVWGPDHATTLGYVNNLALLYSDMGLLELAEPLTRHVAEVRSKTLGDENQRTIVSRINLALLYARMEKWEEAEREARPIQEICHRTLGPEHLYSLSVSGILGGAVMGQGDADRAEPILQEALEHSRSGLPEGHWRTGVALIRHGSALTALGRFSEAERELLEAERVMREALGTEHQRYREAVEKLIELYDRWGRPMERESWADLLDPPS